MLSPSRSSRMFCASSADGKETMMRRKDLRGDQEEMGFV